MKIQEVPLRYEQNLVKYGCISKVSAHLQTKHKHVIDQNVYEVALKGFQLFLVVNMYSKAIRTVKQ